MVKATDGNPKALALALGHIADNAVPLDMLVRDLYAAADSVAGLFDYFFSQAWIRCSQDARALWQVIPFFAGPVRREVLAAVAGLQGRYFYDALEQVRGRSLLDVEEGSDGEPRYQAHPMVRAFAAARLREAPDFETQARERWVEHYAHFLADHANEDWPTFAILDKEYENIIATLTWSLTCSYPHLPTMVRYFWHYLYIRGHWRQCETYTRQAIEQATNQGDTFLRLWLTAHLAWVLEERGQVEEALEYLHQVEAEILVLDQTALLEGTDVLNYLGQAYLWSGDLDRAEAYENRFWELAEEVDDRRSSLVARYYLSWISARRGLIDEAEQQYRMLVGEAQDIGWERAEGYCTYRLALGLICLGYLEEAEQQLNQVGVMADRWREPLLQAHVLFGRAQLEQGRAEDTYSPHEAKELALAALDRYERLGAQPEIKDVTVFLDGL